MLNHPPHLFIYSPQNTCSEETWMLEHFINTVPSCPIVLKCIRGLIWIQAKFSFSRFVVWFHGTLFIKLFFLKQHISGMFAQDDCEDKNGTHTDNSVSFWCTPNMQAFKHSVLWKLFLDCSAENATLAKAGKALLSQGRETLAFHMLLNDNFPTSLRVR